MLGRLVDETIASKGFAYPWGDLLPLLREADLFMINLECALTAQTERWHRNDEYKAFYFRADPAVAQALQLGSVAFASLANNHSGDFRTEGMLETLKVLDRAGIAHAGAGTDRSAAQAPAVLSAKDWRVAVVAFADHPAAWAAKPGAPGLNYTPITLAPQRFGEIESALAVARQQADLVIFSIHWGPNLRERPTGDFRDFARRVIEAGADVYWGHSAHVVQGVELWQGKPILYDTGDFVDDYKVHENLRNDLSALFMVNARPPLIESLELVPVKIGRMQVNLAQGPDRDWFVQRFTDLCAEIGTEVRAAPQRLAIPIALAQP